MSKYPKSKIVWSAECLGQSRQGDTVKKMQQAEAASWFADAALANKPIYRDQALGDGIDCQEKAFKSHGTEQSRTVGGDEALSGDFITVQGQSRFSHGTNVSLPAGDHNSLRPSRFQPSLSANGRGTTVSVAPVSTSNSTSSARPVGPVKRPFI